jgi:hypothetical protein
MREGFASDKAAGAAGALTTTVPHSRAIRYFMIPSPPRIG